MFLALFFLALMAGCRRGGADAEFDQPVEPRPAEADTSEDEPADAGPRGAVLTVLTALGPSAPAGALDRVAMLRVRLTSGSASESLDIPLGGSGVLALEEAGRNGVLWVQVLDPALEEIGRNTIDVHGLAGTIGVVALELGSMAGRRACSDCSPPEPLTEVLGLVGSTLYWSAGSQVVSADSESSLHVAIRAAASSPDRNALVHAAGGRIITESLVDDTGLVWSVVAPAGATDIVDLALSLARRREVKGMELYREGRSGRFLVP